MSTLTKVWIWVKNHWQVVVVAVAAILAFALGGFAVRKLRRPDKTIRRELAASKAATNAASVAVVHGKEAAVKAIEEQHAVTIKAFDDGQRAKLAALRKSPEHTARWLSKLTD